MKRYRLVVLGASFLGIGAALTEPADTVIIEPSCRLGDDYVNCLCAQDWRTVHPCTKPGKQLYSEMEKRGLLYKDGSVYAEPAIFILSKWLYQSNVSVCLSTTVTLSLIHIFFYSTGLLTACIITSRPSLPYKKDGIPCGKAA